MADKDPTTVYFERLATERHPMLNRMTATIRFDLDSNGNGGRTTHWYLDIDKGTVAVSHRNARADAIVRTDRATFEKLTTGEANAMAATLRGQISVEGDRQLMVAFQRIMPGPPTTISSGSTGSRSVT
jgi:putative sterol carrier protein